MAFEQNFTNCETSISLGLFFICFVLQKKKRKEEKEQEK
jgi:hypothetical protein